MYHDKEGKNEKEKSSKIKNVNNVNVNGRIK